MFSSMEQSATKNVLLCDVCDTRTDPLSGARSFFFDQQLRVLTDKVMRLVSFYVYSLFKASWPSFYAHEYYTGASSCNNDAANCEGTCKKKTTL